MKINMKNEQNLLLRLLELFIDLFIHFNIIQFISDSFPSPFPAKDLNKKERKTTNFFRNLKSI